jgi:nitroreductase
MEKQIYSSLNLEEHQTKIPGTHMMLAALEQGVYSTWISYFDVEKLSTLLSLPQNIIPSEIIAFGYPKDKIQKRQKKTIQEIVFYNSYNK